MCHSADMSRPLSKKDIGGENLRSNKSSFGLQKGIGFSAFDYLDGYLDKNV